MSQLNTVPQLKEIEVNISRVLAAALTLMAKTPLFIQQPMPDVSPAEFHEALETLEATNRALLLDASLTGDTMRVMHQNATRITQLAVLGRVIRHLERSRELLEPQECVLVVRSLGPSADAVHLLGMRILAALLEEEQAATSTEERFPWELLMVDGAIQAARDELATTATLSRAARRYARATLWAFHVARDALLAVASR